MSALTGASLVSPWDKFNQELVSLVRPADWVNPSPAPCYNLVIIGGGTAGLVAAAGGAQLGAKVALIERHLLGGDCLNVGCIPSQCLIRSSRAAFDARDAGRFGVRVPPGVETDFPEVMARMRRLRASVSHHDSAARFVKLGVDVFFGNARFLASDSVEVAGHTLRFKRAVLATGTHPALPPVAGLSEAGFFTNETIFNLTECPRRLVVLGGGPLGCELTQAFQRLGSQVILFDKNAHLLDREDADAAALVQAKFVQDGVQLVLDANVTHVECETGGKRVHFESGGAIDSVVADDILVGTGRAPNVEGMNLETAGVQYSQQEGVLVNDQLQTTNPRIYAAGDVCLQWKFTHAADAAARLVLHNALFLGRKRLSALTIPRCTYTDPEIAHVGLQADDACKRGLEVDTYTRHFKDVDRARMDGEEGFVKIHVKKGKDQILGATIVARHAGDMISEICVAMAAKLGLGKLASVLHPYPTQAEAIRQCGDAYNRTRLTPFLKSLLERWLTWQRR